MGFQSFFSTFGINCCMALIIWYGSNLCKDRKISVGDISAFLLYMIQIIFCFMVMGFGIANMFKVAGAAHKIMEMMKHKPRSVNPKGGDIIPEEQLVGEIEFKNVTFNYPTKPDVQVCNNVSFKVPQNKQIALVGPSGSGKSSIIALIERFYDPHEGSITFSGVDIRELNPSWYKSQVSIVQQEPVLKSGSIMDNIIYGFDRSHLSDGQLKELVDDACKKANAYKFIHDADLFPLGYDTLVGERGMKLSGGQKQRIAIARALFRKPKVLLLDEATSALDAESESLVQKALDDLIKEGLFTVIVIAHRLSTIRNADQIIVIKYGQIAEIGSHNELLRNEDGEYKKLISRQLENSDAMTAGKGTANM